MEDVEQLNIQLLDTIIKHIAKEDLVEDQYTKNSLMEIIHLRNIELHTALKDFFLALESLQFISSDYQLRLKAADIWASQKDMFSNILITRAEDLSQITKDLGLDTNDLLKKITG